MKSEMTVLGRIMYKMVFCAIAMQLAVFFSPAVKMCFAEQEQKPLHLLVFDSYNPLQAWSQSFLEGLLGAQHASDRRIIFYLEYLDRLRLTDGISEDELYSYLKGKYSKIEISGIIANSNSAADFVEKYGHALAGDVPIAAYTTRQNQRRDSTISSFTLHEEVEQSVTETLEFALKQNPKARSVLIIEGNNDASRSRVSILNRELAKKGTLPVQIIHDFSMEELKKTVSALERNTIVFCTLVTSDTTGRAIIPQNAVKEIASLSPAPIYSFWNTFVQEGVVGGRVIDAKKIGFQLVTTVEAYLADSSFRKSYSTLQTYFNWEAVKRYGIDPDTIPADAAIINREQKPWLEYRHQPMMVICILLLSFCVFYWFRKLAVLNSMLRRSRDELEIRVEERTRALADSEMRFHALSDASFEGIVLIKDGKILESNTAVCENLGYLPEELINKTVVSLVAPEEREKVQNKILSGYDKPYESACLKKDGTLIPVEIRGKMFSYRGEMVRVTAVRNISARKRAEKALQEANKELRDMAMQDGLTRIANRRYFDIKIKREWRRMTRIKTPLSLILYDVDHFKYYNDTYGHQAGDACLQTIAHESQALFKRPGDMLARYGGEEFIVVLPDTTHGGAVALAERIRRTIYALKIEHKSSPVSQYVTVSCGVASIIPTRSADPQVLIESADRALYEAKETGRNKVVGLLNDS